MVFREVSVNEIREVLRVSGGRSYVGDAEVSSFARPLTRGLVTRY